MKTTSTTDTAIKKNPIARWLRQRRYRMLVIKNKKKYNRRKNDEIIKELQSSGTD
jgi:hypothetical protein